MKVPRPDAYWAGSLACALTAILLISLAFLTNRGDLTTAALVLAGAVCIITGILLATLSRGDSMDPGIAGLLPVQGCINLSRVCADLGLKGNAFLVPGRREGGGSPMQFIPVTTFSHAPPEGEIIVSGEGAHGVLVVPSGIPLLDRIRKDTKVLLPGSVEEWVTLVRELCCEVLGIAGDVRGGRSGDCITLTLDGYRFRDGCEAMRRESPKCCTMNPCPVASLAGCLLAEGLGKVIEVRACTPSRDRQSVTLVFCPVTADIP
jgi:hypothetical protein